MIISRTPLRLSFVVGGTDVPEFYEQHGGAVVSTTIDKWIHGIVARRFEGMFGSATPEPRSSKTPQP